MRNLELFYSVFGHLNAPYATTKIRPEQLTKLRPAYKPLKITDKNPIIGYFKRNSQIDKNVNLYPENYRSPDGKKLLPHHYLTFLSSTGKGTGSKGMREVITKSLEDSETQGRVILCANGNGNDSPCCFYKLLGFSSINAEHEKLLNEWLRSGAKRKNAPKILETMMYLPKENIQIALNYGLWDMKNSLKNESILDIISSWLKGKFTR